MPTQGQGSPAPEAGTADDVAVKYVTNEELNRAISARFADHQKKQDKSFDAFGSALTAKIDELLTSKVEALKTPEAAKADPAHPAPIEEHPQFKGLQKQLSDLQKKTETAERERDAEKAKARDTALRERLREGLGGAGIADPISMKHALGVLVDSEKRVRWDDEATGLVFKGSDGDEVDLATGLKSWVQTPEGKRFLPPSGASGSGARPGGGSPGLGKGKTPVRGELGRALLASLGDMPGSSNG